MKDWPEDAKASLLQCRANCMPQVDALIAAGWVFELPEVVNRKEGEPPGMDTEPWQWYWRSPKKGKRRRGHKYMSTQQAFNALQKQNGSLERNSN
jgi:hypothetical protein